jgi:hypothetical protein
MTGGSILLAIGLQGIQILDFERRDRIAHHIDYEDILYVMGKGTQLKIGFLYANPLLDRAPVDCRTDFHTVDLGCKARVIAEDIIAYA